jgi:hypothetical protein
MADLIPRQVMNYVCKGRRFTGCLNLLWRDRPTEKDRTDLQAQTLEGGAVVLVVVHDHDIGLRRPGETMK